MKAAAVISAFSRGIFKLPTPTALKTAVILDVRPQLIIPEQDGITRRRSELEIKRVLAEICKVSIHRFPSSLLQTVLRDSGIGEKRFAAQSWRSVPKRHLG